MMKAYLFCTHHGLPAAMLMTEKGEIVQVHGGGDIEDAKQWFYYHKKDKGYEVEEIDQKIIDKFLYEDGLISNLPDGFRQAMELNQMAAEEAANNK